MNNAQLPNYIIPIFIGSNISRIIRDEGMKSTNELLAKPKNDLKDGTDIDIHVILFSLTNFKNFRTNFTYEITLECV